MTWQDSGLPVCYAWLRTIRGNVKSKPWSPWPLKTKVESPFETSGINNPGRLRFKCHGTRAETRFRLSAKRTSPFKSAGASVQSTAGSRGMRISGSNGSNAGYTMFRGSVKSTGYPLHSPVSPSLPLQGVTVCHQVSTGFGLTTKKLWIPSTNVVKTSNIADVANLQRSKRPTGISQNSLICCTITVHSASM